MPTVNAENNYVSRAEGKLAGAVRAFSYDFRNKIVLDIGSSTGGFTELALKLGAKKVVAVEKGTNQMKTPLRFDSRIELHEKTDFFSVVKDQAVLSPGLSNLSSQVSSPNSRQQPPKCVKMALSLTFDTVLADVSFVSLKKILWHAKQFADFDTDFLVMLKPQFEASSRQLWKGIVKNEKIRREIIKDFEMWLKMNKFLILKKHDNEVVGKNGNQERFYWLKLAK